VKALRPLLEALKATVFATAAFAVLHLIIASSGWQGLTVVGVDLTLYVVFFVIFFLSLVIAARR
jgi:hypothetical protein